MTTATTDVPGLWFVDPTETDATLRICLWAAPGAGKSVAAASAPGPVMVLSADRPSAYRFARRHHTGQEILETRYQDAGTLSAVFRFLSSPEGNDVRTLVIDPVSSIYDQLVDSAPLRGDGEPDYQAVNKKLLGFVQSLRRFDINVVLVAHEKLNDGKRGDGKLYPALGGPALINKLLAEMDVVAHVERHVRTTEDGEDVRWVGQLQPRDNLVCKESTGVLGDRRILDLSRWIEVYADALQLPADPDDPFAPGLDDLAGGMVPEESSGRATREPHETPPASTSHAPKGSDKAAQQAANPEQAASPAGESPAGTAAAATTGIGATGGNRQEDAASATRKDAASAPDLDEADLERQQQLAEQPQPEGEQMVERARARGEARARAHLAAEKKARR